MIGRPLLIPVLALLLASRAASQDELVFVDGFETDISTCGNRIVEPGETCDGNCGCDEAFPGYTSTGTPDTCDVQCHIPIQTCQGGDGVCPFRADSGGQECGSTNDSDCNGASWTGVQFTGVNTVANQCTTVRVYGIQVGGSYEFTTCAPPGVTPGSGDPAIVQVTDNLGQDYIVANDDCVDPTALPNLAGWECRNDAGLLRMACASPNPSGFRIANAMVTYLDVRVCRVGDAGGNAPLNIWYNATAAPNPG